MKKKKKKVFSLVLSGIELDIFGLQVDALTSRLSCYYAH